ncbi:MAG: type III-B CRISPR module RAMP protein Cmr1 [Desulfosalsimonas sp.]
MTFYISRFKGMEQKEFEVEVVTPLFLGGADPKKAELRAPSVKGALRFWWRALFPHLPLNQLKDEESKIFGDVGDRYGKSKMQIKIQKSLINKENSKANPLPHKNVNFRFPCFYPGEKFSLLIYGNSEVFNIFKLTTLLGGLGKRSRRGFGSLKITKIDKNEFSFPVNSEQIAQLIKKITKEDFFTADQGQILRKENISANYGYIKSIELGQSHTQYNKILQTIGQSSHNNNSDYTGYARGHERFSSPVYVSIIKTDEIYKPVVTTLNAAFKRNNQNHGIDKSGQFKSDILTGGPK